MKQLRVKHLMVSMGFLAVAGCGVGEGVGRVAGMLYVHQCTPDSDYGTPATMSRYELDPEFFVGEPIEDIRKDGIENRIVIRIETVGRRVRNSGGIIARGVVKDQIIFDIDVYPVARCVSAAAAGMITAELQSFCYLTAEGRPRVRIGPEQPVRVSFVPRATCPRNAYVVGAARGDDPRPTGVRQPVPPTAWQSWMEWTYFGSAQRGGVQEGFSLEFGERLQVENFQVAIDDDKVIKAEIEERLSPTAEIKAELGGTFDFDLDRGQGAQTFP